MQTTSIESVVEGFKVFLFFSQLHKINSPIHARITEWAKVNPKAVAVRHKTTEISYEELDLKSNIIAQYLLEQGVQKEDCIGVHLKETVLIPIVILGIMKAGTTYVPLSTDFPANRINNIIADASINFVFTDLGKGALFNPDQCIQELDSELNQITHKNLNPPNLHTEHEDAAYIIYTSGSTGDPKGVIVSHGSMTNYLDWYLEDLRLQSQADLPLTSSISFAAGVTQLFSALLLGKTLHIINRDEVRQPALLLDWYMKNPGYALYCVPTLWEEVMNYAESAPNAKLNPPACLYLSGESLSKSLVDRTFKRWPDLLIWNLYGPTEATANVSYYKVEKDKEIYLGKPIRGACLLLLDENLGQVPDGEEGYIYVTSQALAREYRNKPELSKKSFIINHSVKGFEGCTLYNTGDIGRFTTDQQLVFLGRKDQQVKIRGHRIELSEVERYLQFIPGVRQTACSVLTDAAGQARIHAFVVSSEGVQLSVNAIREELMFHLPVYMIPEVFHFLESMPKLSNGKINRNQLVQQDFLPVRPALSYDFAAPQNDEEKILLGIWEEVLQVKGPGMSDDFFDLGGHSLKMVRMIHLIKNRLGKDVNIQTLWEHTTPAALLAYLNQQSHAVNPTESLTRQLVSKKSVPLSIPQMGMWFTLQSRPDLTAYNLLFTITLSGNAVVEKVQKVLNALLAKHDMLRSNFRIENQNPVRIIHDQVAVELPVTDLSGYNPALQAKIEQELCTGFFELTPDLADDKLIRFHLVKTDRNKLFVSVHHLIFDGFSIELFSEDFARMWEAEDLPESEPTHTYADYTYWQKKNYYDGTLSDSFLFWKDRLSNANYFLNFPTDHPRPKVQRNAGKNKVLTIDADEFHRLKQFNRAEKSTPFIVLLSVFQLLLQRYTRETDILIGVPFANRELSETRSVIGMFVNTVVYRCINLPQQSFRDLLIANRNYMVQALEHQGYPFSKLVEQLNPERSVSYHPLFQVMFAYNDKLPTIITADSTQILTEEIQNPGCKFDLDVEAQENEDTVTVNFHYNTELFEEATIEALMAHYRYLLHQALEQPQAITSSFRLEDSTLLEKKWGELNNTAVPEAPGCLQERFEQQANRTPEKIAITFATEHLTYDELNERANRVAHLLRDKGAGADHIVGIMADRSLEMMVGILGILKSGAAYLPIDPNAPPERIDYMIDNSALSVMLVQRDHKIKIRSNVNVLDLNDEALFASMPSENPVLINTPHHLAYVIYTSGSTGQPKGVMIEHRSVMNRIAWMQKEYPLGDGDVILQKTPTTFDVSVWELFWWFFEGSSLHLLEPGGEKNPETIIRSIQTHRISTLHFVPSMFNALLEYVQNNPVEATAFDSLKQLFTSGEAIEKYHVEKFNRLIGVHKNIRLINLYGPTEATVDVSFFDCAQAQQYTKVPIGKPIDNIQLYVLDEQGQPLPERIPGELCIGGIGLARGYLNNPILTAEKFFKSTFNDQRLYRTGDLARRLPDGNIEYLGRTDNQIKIRGFRIELGEIENRINRHSEVETSVAIIKKIGQDDLRLVAYFVPRNRQTKIDLKTHLKAFLPDYMIPSVFVELDSLPLLSNGKLDTKSLPDPFEGQQKAMGERIYHNDYEKRLAHVWSQTLKHDAFDTEDNFYDVGGYSLLLIKMKMVLDTEFNLNIALVDLFQYPTIRSMADVIANKAKNFQKATIAGRAQLQRTASRLKR